MITVPVLADSTCFAELQAVGDGFLVSLPAGADLDRLLNAVKPFKLRGEAGAPPPA